MRTDRTYCAHCSVKDRCIFIELPKAELERRVHLLRYDPGQTVFHEGDPAFGLYVVYEGEVKLFRRTLDGQRQILRIVGPAGLLGEEALIAEATYRSSAQALIETKLLFIARSDMVALMHNASVMRRLLEYLLNRLHSLEELLLVTCHDSTKERLAWLLLRLAHEYGRSLNGKIVIELKLTQAELAEMLGLTRETINKHLNTLRKEGLLSYHKGYIVIDQLALERLWNTCPVSTLSISGLGRHKN